MNQSSYHSISRISYALEHPPARRGGAVNSGVQPIFVASVSGGGRTADAFVHGLEASLCARIEGVCVSDVGCRPRGLLCFLGLPLRDRLYHINRINARAIPLINRY